MTRSELDTLKARIQRLKEMSADMRGIAEAAGNFINLLPDEIRTIINKYV